MERIPVTRKKGTPAWLWILLLLLLLGLLYFLFFRKSNNNDEWMDDTTMSSETYDSSSVNSPAPPPPGNDTTGSASTEVTDLKPVYTASDKQSYVGRQVNLQNVQVHKVISDTTFWIGDSHDQRMFVTGVRNGNATQKLKEGQKISIKGRIEKMPDENTRKSGWGINDQTDFNGQGLYLRAQEIM
jgi:hypothetical protein